MERSGRTSHEPAAKPAAPPGPARTAARPGRLRLYHPAVPFVFIGPALVYFAAISYAPMLTSLWLSLHAWDILNPRKPFIGLWNYVSLLRDATFLLSLKNTAVYVAAVTAVGIPLALAVASAAHRLTGSVRLAVRYAFFLPLATPMVAAGLIWRWMYEPRLGLVNVALGGLGLPGLPWLQDPRTAMPAVILMSLWKSLGYNVIIFLAGLQSIPEEFLDAAKVDGASSFQRFRFVTLPLLKPTQLFVLVTTLIAAFQVFTEVFILTTSAGVTAGGPANSTRTLVLHIYETAFTYLKMGRASAMASVLLVIILLLTLIQLRLYREERFY